MHEEHERGAESTVHSSAMPPAPARLEMLDVAGAIAAAEKAAGSRTFGDPTANGDLAAALADATSLAEKGARAAVIAPVERLASLRDSLRRAAGARRGLVVHAVAGHGAEDLAALTDLGWGVLCASGPEDSFDLSLVARRAAEDSGVPFIVVHGLARAHHPAGRAVAMVGHPREKALAAFIGEPRPPRAAESSHALSGERGFAERVPFALGAAFREYGAVTGRRHDAFDKIPLGESPLVLLGLGPVGDALFCATHELRARGYDVGAVHITSLRPFPGPRLVKALARALAITILEPADEPLAHGALLARDVKSAFTDALTWMPGFPGIGRIPKLFVGATGSAFDLSDLAAACDNMLADERGQRIFSFVDGTLEHKEAKSAERDLSMRIVVDDLASADAVLHVVGTALANAAGLRTHGIVTSSSGGGAVLDLVASRDQARGGMARRAPRLVLATERGMSSAGAVVALAEGAVLGLLGVGPGGVLPEAVRTALRERRARVLPLPFAGAPSHEATIAGAAGAALAVAARVLKLPLDGAAAAAVVAAATTHPTEASGPSARRTFEATRDALSA